MVLHRVSNYYTVKCQIFAFNLEKFTPGKFFFTQVPLVVLVTNKRYDLAHKCYNCIFTHVGKTTLYF